MWNQRHANLPSMAGQPNIAPSPQSSLLTMPFPCCHKELTMHEQATALPIPLKQAAEA